MDLRTWNFLDVILTSNRTKRNHSFGRRRRRRRKKRKVRSEPEVKGREGGSGNTCTILMHCTYLYNKIVKIKSYFIDL
jgi:hypothetical protein